QGRSLDNLAISIEDNFSGRQAVFDLSNATLARIDYYETKKIPIRFKLEDVTARSPVRLVIRASSGDKVIAETSDAIEIFPKPAAAPAPPDHVVVVKPGESLASVRDKAEAGATVIVLSPANKAIAAAFPDDYFDDAAEREKDRKATAARAAARAATRPKKP